MEIKQYFYLFKRWLWLILLGGILGVAAGYVYSDYQTPIYQTSTRVMVSSSPQGLSSNPYAFYYDQQLAETYVQILTTRPVLEGTAEYLGYPVSVGQITTQQVSGSQILRVTVEDSNPEHAAAIANQLVQVLIERNESLQAGQYAASEENLQSQIDTVEEQIAQFQADLDNLSTRSLSEQIEQVRGQMEPLQSEVAQLQKDIALLTPANTQERRVKVAEMQSRLDQLLPLLDLYQQIYTNLVVLGSPGESVHNQDAVIAQLQSTLELYQQIYLNLINSREALRLSRLQNTPNVVQIEAAPVPTNPIRPRPVNTMAMAGVVGLMLMAGGVFLIEYLDDTLRTPEDVERVLELPVVGYIAEMQYAKGSEEYLYVARQPRSPVSEAFRSLRVNLEFASVDAPLRTILVTSPGPGEGKTTVSANLAAIIAQGGKTPMLLDADMRRPRVHKLLNLTNRVGLSDLFREHINPGTISHNWNGHKNMQIITSGSLPPNPAELLGSGRMEAILRELATLVDVVIIDSPPAVVTDAQVLAAKVDGILMVIQPGKTDADAALAMREQFERAGGHMLGVVFNRIPRNRHNYYGGYRYYSPYYYSNDYAYSVERPGGTDEKFNEKKASRQPARLWSRKIKARLDRKPETVEDHDSHLSN